MAQSIEELLQDVIERLDQISALQIAQAKTEPQPLLTPAELARELKFTDVDGKRPTPLTINDV